MRASGPISFTDVGLQNGPGLDDGARPPPRQEGPELLPRPLRDAGSIPLGDAGRDLPDQEPMANLTLDRNPPGRIAGSVIPKSLDDRSCDLPRLSAHHEIKVLHRFSVHRRRV
jgi:hypothetical protein